MSDEFKSDSILQEHYVYIFLDKREKVKYVGYGRLTCRATKHLSKSHNKKLDDFLKNEKYKIRIAGPFGNEKAGRAVETALISAVNPEFNIAEGHSLWRFRPLGIPENFAERLDFNFLSRSDFLNIQAESPTPVLFVRVGEENFPDGRVGYDPGQLPSDQQIRERVDRFWQLHKYLPSWRANPNSSPGLLIGIHGVPGSQIVIASLRIARNKWASVEQLKHGRIQIPIEQPNNLDVFGLRGRKLSRKAGLRFGALRSQFYILLNTNGDIEGGNL